jgi:hypothetical protein
MVETRAMRYKRSTANSSDSDGSYIKTRSQKKAYGEVVIQKIVDFYSANGVVPKHGNNLYEDSLADFLDEFNKPYPFCFSSHHKNLLLQVYPWLNGSSDSDVQTSDDEAVMEAVCQCNEVAAASTNSSAAVVSDSTPAYVYVFRAILIAWALVMYGVYLYWMSRWLVYPNFM